MIQLSRRKAGRLASALTFAWLTACSSSSTSPQAPSSATTTTTAPATAPAATPTPVVTAESCAYTLSTTSQGIIGEGGSFSFNLTRTTGTCSWTATADSWITVTPPSGNGSTTVTASVGRNGSPDRAGAITISWTSPADGPKSARVAVSQNDLVPLLMAGTITSEPQGGALMAATAVAFSIAANPSGGIPPYNYSWDFGDATTGAGTSPTHTFNAPGTFQVVLTVSDNRAVKATAQMTIPVVAVTGSWRATINGAVEPKIDLTQTGATVSASINTVNPNGSPRVATGSGSVSHPRKMTVTLVFQNAGAAVYTGSLDALLTTWSGTVTGYGGCPCTFVAGKTSN